MDGKKLDNYYSLVNLVSLVIIVMCCVNVLKTIKHLYGSGNGT